MQLTPYFLTPEAQSVLHGVVAEQRVERDRRVQARRQTDHAFAVQEDTLNRVEARHAARRFTGARITNFGDLAEVPA